MTLKKLSVKAIDECIRKRIINHCGNDAISNDTKCIECEAFEEAMNKVKALLKDYYLIKKKGSVKKTTEEIGIGYETLKRFDKCRYVDKEKIWVALDNEAKKTR